MTSSDDVNRIRWIAAYTPARASGASPLGGFNWTGFDEGDEICG
jgi:hypothetical protein